MMDEEIRQALSEVREMKQMCGNINMKLTNIVTQRGQDWKKKLEAKYQRGLEDGKKAFDLLGAERDSEYQRGLSDGNDIGYKDGVKDGQNEAWEAAKKIFGYEIDGGIPIDKVGRVFGYSEDATFCTADIIRHNTASEAIAKLKAYEEKQKAEVPIMAGDEVKAEDGTVVFFVTWMSDRCICGVDKEGKCYSYEPKEICGKTGRHFDIILEEKKA